MNEYIDLQRGIIERAEEDYIKALFFETEPEIKELEKFYKSNWGKYLTLDNGERIMERCKNSVQEMKKIVTVKYVSQKRRHKKWLYITTIPTTPREPLTNILGYETMSAQKDEFLTFKKYLSFRVAYQKLKSANFI